MAAKTIDVVVLDNKDSDVRDWLQQLLREKSSRCPALSTFVAGFSDVLRTELASLPLAQQRLLPSFGTLITFYNEYAHQDYQLEGINCAMLCFGQLSHWIR